jgi:thiol:disulfide interchange protein DsbD
MHARQAAPRPRGRALLRCAGFLAFAAACFGQINALTVGDIAPVRVRAGQTVEVKLPLQLKAGFHVQSNTPTDAYLIPLRVTWNPGPLTVSAIEFPKPKMEKYAFDEKPLSVFTEDFFVTTKFTAAPNATPGSATVTGKVRYQACTDRECFPPRNADVALKVTILK